MEYKNELLYLLNQLNGKGAFLTAGKKPNTMTISWGFAGVMWGNPIILAPVRPSRFTHGLIVENKEFAVSVPLDNSMDNLLAYFGSVSGRDTDKYKDKGIKVNKCKSIDTFIMPGKCMHFECKLIYTSAIMREKTSQELLKFYNDNAFHAMFFGQIINAYSTE